MNVRAAHTHPSSEMIALSHPGSDSNPLLEPWPTDTLNPYLSRVFPRDSEPELQYPELTERGTQQLPHYYSLPLTQIDNHGSAMVPITE